MLEYDARTAQRVYDYALERVEEISSLGNDGERYLTEGGLEIIGEALGLDKLAVGSVYYDNVCQALEDYD